MTESDKPRGGHSESGGAQTPPDESRDPDPTPPTSKPLGDAIPTPTEPGLDQPLPPKPRPEGDESDKP
jgi:hypothetical protein